jgi:hypothetical protein
MHIIKHQNDDLWGKKKPLKRGHKFANTLKNFIMHSKVPYIHEYLSWNLKKKDIMVTPREQE